MTSFLHEERLSEVISVVKHSRANRVLDLGCGDGDMFMRLVKEPEITELVGLDICRASLDRLHAKLAACETCVPRIELREASMTDPARDLTGFDCAVLVETIEHINPGELSKLERAIFHIMRPKTIVVTTPNSEFNVLLGVPPHRMRHPDHRFEWDRTQFRRWSARVAQTSGYADNVRDIAGRHPRFGGASQMAVFRMIPAENK